MSNLRITLSDTLSPSTTTYVQIQFESMIKKIHAIKKMKNEGINFSECIDKNNAQQDVTLFIR